MDISQATAKRILNLCETQDISINKLASLSQVTQSTINSIVSGESKNPKLKTILKICYGLNISLKDFFNSPYFDNLI
ncbi:helix-turn-helix domain-containing protein [Anaerosalibacter massiliensis]|uniref:Helix-turn-helix domain-containing protein n=1 Tax=Anaerosalibacter massiliensis TaxID=1347392 RepID=A0A9X2MH55_9FIRM|nr:helix-turn-helix transcriptional regulator [Anaerosalibacter massiliensis]MCR2043549.1 helix-turn-helix domain-containing protein [Anaerosalibacter massiliensis]